MRRPRVVLDAGVLVSALLRPEGPPGGLLRLLIEQRAFELVMSDAILEELRGSLADPSVRRVLAAAPGSVDRWAAALGLLAVPVDDVGTTWDVSEDPADTKYVAAAVESGADMIISSDPHLLELGDRQPVQVVTPRVFLEVLELAGEAEG